MRLGGSGGLKEAKILLAAIAGGVLATPLAAHAQVPDPPERLDPDAYPPLADPIVPESEFEEALPPLDPALYEPLEPLEPVDPAAPPFPPVPGPVEDAPLGDPALA